MTKRTRSASPTSSAADVLPSGGGGLSALRLPISARTVLLAAIAAYLAAVAVWPLARLFAEALAPGDDGALLGLLREQWQGRATGRALRNTIEASVFATLLSVVLGAAAAALVTLTDIRAKSAVVFTLLLPLIIPSQITALAWIELTGPSSAVLQAIGLAPPPGTTNPLYSKWGIVLVMGAEHGGLVFLAVRAGLTALPKDLVEAARLGGARPRRIARSVLLPLALPSVLGGAALAFVASIGNFGVPAMLGIPGRYTMMTTLIFQRLQGFGPSVLGEVAALALILTTLAVLGLAVRALLARRFGVSYDRGAGTIEPFRLGRGRLPVEAVAWIALFVLSVLPLFALLSTALLPALGVPLNPDTASLANFRFVLFGYEAAQRAFANSFGLALGAALGSALVALPLAYYAVIEKRPLARFLDLVADTPYAIPGTVLGIAIIMVYLPPLPVIGVSIYNTGWIILIADPARFLALAMRPTVAAMEGFDPVLDEAARASGAGPLRRLRSVVLPVVAPSVAAGALLIFMQAFNELTVSALLWSTGWETLGVVVFFLHREGNTTAAAALATLTVIVTLGLAAAITLFARWMPKDVLPWRA